MEIILILILLSIVILICIILYKLIRWILHTKTRRIRALSLLFALMVGFGIYQLYFVKLEFIQSKVYPDLYLVKNVPEDRNTLNQAIKDFIITHMKTQPTDSNLSLRFYQYYKSYNPLVFGDAGTAYFIDHKEDFEGMVVEDLSMYTNLKLAVVEKTMCENKTDYCAKVEFYDKGRKVKTDMINIIYQSETNQTN